MKPKILVTLQNGNTKNTHFPEPVLERLGKLGEIHFNESNRAFTPEQLRTEAAWADICLTMWGCPCFSEEILQNAPNLKLIAHGAGTVANLCSPAVFQRGIKVTSANDIMALYVAEGALACILSSLRQIPKADQLMKNGVLWPRENSVRAETLINKRISLIGLGAIGRRLIQMLEPFNVSVCIYDPYISEEQLAAENFSNVKLKSLDEALSFGDIISIHASLTSDTVDLLGANELALVKDHGTIINTARGAIINEKALIEELQKGRLYAVLDVYDPEPPAMENPLRKLENAILIPHMAGQPVREAMTIAMLDEIERFLNGKPLLYEIKRERFEKMTDSSLVKSL